MFWFLAFTVKSLIYIITTSKWFETNILTVESFIKFRGNATVLNI